MAVRTDTHGVIAEANSELREQILPHRRLFEGFLREYEAGGLA